MDVEINKIYCMDCLQGLKRLDDNSVDLIITDPPYFEIMVRDYKGVKHEWDSQWDSFEDYISWCRLWFLEIKRILKLNGSLYVFADDKISAYIQVELDKLFNLENNIIWVKPNNMTMKGWTNYRSYAPITERILFYSNEGKTRNLKDIDYAENIKIFSPLIEYMKEQKELIKEYFNFETNEEFNQYINKVTETKSIVSRHYFTYSQWVFPTKELYTKLQSINKNIFKKEYEVFKKEYEVFKKEYEEKRRTFNPVKNYTDVWIFNITSSGETTFHPTQKPIKLIRRIIETSSDKDSLVLDPFMGSGTTAVACKELGRNFIGFELDQKYVDIANERLKHTEPDSKQKGVFDY